MTCSFDSIYLSLGVTICRNSFALFSLYALANGSIYNMVNEM